MKGKTTVDDRLSNYLRQLNKVKKALKSQAFNTILRSSVDRDAAIALSFSRYQYNRSSYLKNLLSVRPILPGICLLFMLFSACLSTTLNAKGEPSQTEVEASFRTDQFGGETTFELRDESTSFGTEFQVCDVTLDPVATTEESCQDAEDGSISAVGNSSLGSLIYFLRGPADGINSTGLFTNLPSGNYTVTVALNSDTICNSRQAVTVGLNDVDCSTLPVEFGTFTIESSNGEHILNWNTYAELNNDGFIVERSVDGKSYKKIGWQEGAGTSDKETLYYFSDKNVQSNITYYYRLKQMDFDGKFEYSNVKSAIFKDDRAARVSEIFPNPATSQANFQINVGKDMSTSIYIYDAVGKLVLNLEQAVNEGTNAVEIDLSSFDNGMYFTRVIMGKESFYQKLIVKK